MSYPPIQIVDENDTPLGGASIKEAREKGLYHRIVRIMVEDNQGRVLLQMRSNTMTVYPNCWDNSAAGHVDQGETYDQAAYRGLSEEIGLNGVTLEEVGVCVSHQASQNTQTNRFNKLYKVRVPSNYSFILQPEEVTSVQWFTVSEVWEMIKNKTHAITDGLEDVFVRYYS